MDVRVYKYGGSSLRDTAGIRRLADSFAVAHGDGRGRVVVVSAMGDTTDDLLRMAGEVATRPGGSELDALLSTGECVSAGLLTLALRERGVPACSLSGGAAGIITDDTPNEAVVVEVDPEPVRSRVEAGDIVVVTGFQGRAAGTGHVTTLGRGGSDTTAVTLAAALDAVTCEIGTDVDGVYTADPRYVPRARSLERIPYRAMVELARAGARVLAPRCVEYARAHAVPLRVHATSGSGAGTRIMPDTEPTDGATTGVPTVWGVAQSAGHAQYTIIGLPDSPDAIATVFRALAETASGMDMETWGISQIGTNRVDISLVLPGHEAALVEATLTELHAPWGFTWRCARVGKLLVVGSGLRSSPTIPSLITRALSEAGVAVTSTATTEERIAVACAEDELVRALVVAHDRLGLGGTPAKEEPAPAVGGDNAPHRYTSTIVPTHRP